MNFQNTTDSVMMKQQLYMLGANANLRAYSVQGQEAVTNHQGIDI